MVDTSRRADRPLPRIHYERTAGAASAPLAVPGRRYRRREPETTVLHAVVREHLETFLEAARERDGEGYPAFIEREFRRYLDCGMLARGFARLRCPECGFERLVAFSCKGRLCPSCVGRRMADIAAYLVDELLPEAPYRQWVLTFPWVLRFRLAVDRRLFARLLGTFLRTVFAWQRRRGRALGIRDGQAGAVTFVQRFGGALNLNPHLHSLVPDGLFVPPGDGGRDDGGREGGGDGDDEDDGDAGQGRLTFVALPAPTSAEIEALTARLAHRLTGVVERQCADSDETAEILERTVTALREALAKAVEPPLPRPALGLEGLPLPATMRGPLCAKVAGFSLHAARVVGAADRDGLERLCRYGLRAPFSQERLGRRDDGRVVYRLRRPWPNASGATQLVLEPAELLRRLAALVPAPYANMVRYHGVFASRSKWRSWLPPPPGKEAAATAKAAVGRGESEVGPADIESPEDSADLPATGKASSVPAPAGGRGDAANAADLPPPGLAGAHQPRRRPLPWAQLLMRVFFVDALSCPGCASPMVVLALLSDPPVVKKILRHLALPAEAPPLAPAMLAASDGPLFEHGEGEWDASDTPSRAPP